MKFSHDSMDLDEACGVVPGTTERVSTKIRAVITAVLNSDRICRSVFAEQIAENFSYEELVVGLACLLDADVKRQAKKQRKQKDATVEGLTKTMTVVLENRIKQAELNETVRQALTTEECIELPKEEIKQQPLSLVQKLWILITKRRFFTKP